MLQYSYISTITLVHDVERESSRFSRDVSYIHSNMYQYTVYLAVLNLVLECTQLY
jgi:hypothetical protein